MNSLTKYFLILAITSVLTTTLIIVDNNKAKADLFCLPWESNCRVDGSPGTSRHFFHVNIYNQTDRTIWVAVHYKKTFVGGPAWVTEGYWKLAAGEKAYILGGLENAIENRYIYFHAHDQYGNVWGDSEYQWYVNVNEESTVRPFFQADMGATIGEYTQSFTLNSGN